MPKKKISRSVPSKKAKRDQSKKDASKSGASSSPPKKQSPSLKLKINPAYKSLLRPLTEEEYDLLEKSILEHGLKSPILATQNGVVVDGHNRYEICCKHDIEPWCEIIDLHGDAAIKAWIIEHQRGRRNLTAYQRVEYALQDKATIAAKGKENQRAGGRTKQVLQNSANPVRALEEVAKKAGVSRETVRQIEYIIEHADEATKEKFHNGDESVSIHKAFKELKAKQVKKEPVKPNAKTSPTTKKGKVNKSQDSTPTSSSGIAEPEEMRNTGRQLIEFITRNIDKDSSTLLAGVSQICFGEMEHEEKRMSVAEFLLWFQEEGFDIKTEFDKKDSLPSIFAEGNSKYDSYQGNFAVSLIRTGHVLKRKGDLTGADTHYAEALGIRRRLVAKAPDNDVWQQNLAASLNNLGTIREMEGDLIGAKEYYEEAIEIMRRLVAKVPGNDVWQRDLAARLTKLGTIYEKEGGLTDAENTMKRR